MAAYYNEIDPNAAEWLRQLIKLGEIADGEVDNRSITEVEGSDLQGFTQCHFFAGIGVWSYALRLAGWADDREIWTGSCPCQPFSSAGKGKGFEDERHLWPHFHRLIRERCPVVVLGEQVANKAGETWFDVVRADLEAEGYAAGPAVFPACGLGAPHQRKRLYWAASALADAKSERCLKEGEGCGRSTQRTGDCWESCNMADAHSERLQGHRRHEQQQCQEGRKEQAGYNTEDRGIDGPCPTNGLWRTADWIFCRDNKWRPVEPGTFPLVDGAPTELLPSDYLGASGNPRSAIVTEADAQVQATKEARQARLKAYGNAINAEAAKAFIEAYLEI